MIQLTVDRDLTLAKRASDLRQLQRVHRALPSVPGAQRDTRRFKGHLDKLRDALELMLEDGRPGFES